MSARRKLSWQRRWRRFLIAASLQRWVVRKLSPKYSLGVDRPNVTPDYYGVFDSYRDHILEVSRSEQYSDQAKEALIEHYRTCRDVEVKRLTEYRQWQWDDRGRWSQVMFSQEGALGINALHTISLVSVASLGGFFGLIANFRPKNVADDWATDAKFAVYLLIGSVAGALLSAGFAYLSQFSYNVSSSDYEISWKEHEAVKDRPDARIYERVGHFFKALAIVLYISTILLLVWGGYCAANLIAF